MKKLLHHRTRYILLEQFSFFSFLFFPNKKIHYSKIRKAKSERERENYWTGFLAETEVDEEGTQGGEKDTKSNGTKTCN